MSIKVAKLEIAEKPRQLTQVDELVKSMNLTEMAIASSIYIAKASEMETKAMLFPSSQYWDALTRHGIPMKVELDDDYLFVLIQPFVGQPRWWQVESATQLPDSTLEYGFKTLRHHPCQVWRGNQTNLIIKKEKQEKAKYER